MGTPFELQPQILCIYNAVLNRLFCNLKLTSSNRTDINDSNNDVISREMEKTAVFRSGSDGRFFVVSMLILW